jgi:peptidoglycan/xylan/chitin deacetylase (PgdA/CDA1 family)
MKSSGACAWPNGAEAAVSLTYDDSLASQVEFAGPLLDALGLQATFFLSGQNIGSFAPPAKAGHELASHTVRHPCNADLSALSLDEMGGELENGIAAVHALGVTGKLTFAYPCGQTQVRDGASYEPLVRAGFRAARGVAGSVADPRSVDLFNVPALFPPTSSDGSDVIAFVEQAAQSRGWAVVGIHGVTEAGEYLQFSAAAHERLLKYLAEQRQRLWVAPFGAVADVVVACREPSP